MIGWEIANTPGLNWAGRLYIRLLGVPINGLLIRLRRVLPWCTGSPRSILDAGCGRGVFSYYFARRFRGATVVALDLDRQQLMRNCHVSQRVPFDKLFFVQADVTALPFRERFDLVISVDNLEHVEDDIMGLANLFSVLRPGGRLVLHVPGYQRRWPVFKWRINFEVPGHYRPGYTLDRIRSMVVACGLKIHRAYYTFGWLETLSNNISYRITGAEAKRPFVYSLLFPTLNAMAWLGRNSRPTRGAGVLVVADRPKNASIPVTRPPQQTTAPN